MPINSNMKILIIGSGGMGFRHIKALRSIGIDQIYCVDSNQENIEKIKSTYKNIKSSLDSNTLKGIDFSGCIISTPTNLHSKFMKWCLDLNIPFLVEKPLNIDKDGMPKLIKKVEKKNLLAGVAYPRRHSRGISIVKEKIANGDIGKIKLYHSEFSQDFRKYRPDYDKTYYANKDTGGGVLMDALSHHIDQSLYFCSSARQVLGIQDRLVFKDIDVDDTAQIIIKHKNGMISSIKGNQFQKPNTDVLEITGTEGSIIFNRIDGVVKISNNDDMNWKIFETNSDWDDILTNQAKNFISSIQKNDLSSKITTLHEGLHNLDIIFAARESQNKEQFITL